MILVSFIMVVVVIIVIAGGRTDAHSCAEDGLGEQGGRRLLGPQRAQGALPPAGQA